MSSHSGPFASRDDRVEADGGKSMNPVRIRMADWTPAAVAQDQLAQRRGWSRRSVAGHALDDLQLAVSGREQISCSGEEKDGLIRIHGFFGIHDRSGGDERPTIGGSDEPGREQTGL
jgi:hypothetical protein